jgi:hypothetical protein
LILEYLKNRIGGSLKIQITAQHCFLLSYFETLRKMLKVASFSFALRVLKKCSRKELKSFYDRRHNI